MACRGSYHTPETPQTFDSGDDLVDADVAMPSKLERARATIRNIRREERESKAQFWMATGEAVGLTSGSYLGQRLLGGVKVPYTPVTVNVVLGTSAVVADMLGWTEHPLAYTVSGVAKGMALGDLAMLGFKHRMTP